MPAPEEPIRPTDDAPGPISSLPLVYRGKVRDLYEIDAAHWLMVATDRCSAFDVILPTPMPGKGRLLTELALFWFARFRPMIANHLAPRPLAEVLPDPAEREYAAGRSMIVRRLTPIPVEAVVRGYLAGSGWKEYERHGRVCGVDLPPGLELGSALPAPIFTPATKAAVGDHDENIAFDDMAARVGDATAEDIRRTSLAIYRDASAHARARGLLLADTKFEFGRDGAGNLVLMDELLTPDSSRFWEASTWRPGTSPPSFDKQFLRDWLETLDWDRAAPGPALPERVVTGTLSRYREAVARLMSD